MLEFDYEVEQDSDCLRFIDGPGWRGDWWELRVIGPFRHADEATSAAEHMVERDTFSQPFE